MLSNMLEELIIGSEPEFKSWTRLLLFHIMPEKGINPNILPPTMGEQENRLGTNFGLTTSIGEGKLNSNQTWRGLCLAKLFVPKTCYMINTTMSKLG